MYSNFLHVYARYVWQSIVRPIFIYLSFMLVCSSHVYLRLNFIQFCLCSSDVRFLVISPFML